MEREEAEGILGVSGSYSREMLHEKWRAASMQAEAQFYAKRTPADEARATLGKIDEAFELLREQVESEAARENSDLTSFAPAMDAGEETQSGASVGETEMSREPVSSDLVVSSRPQDSEVAGDSKAADSALDAPKVPRDSFVDDGSKTMHGLAVAVAIFVCLGILIAQASASDAGEVDEYASEEVVFNKDALVTGAWKWVEITIDGETITHEDAGEEMPLYLGERHGFAIRWGLPDEDDLRGTWEWESDDVIRLMVEDAFVYGRLEGDYLVLEDEKAVVVYQKAS